MLIRHTDIGKRPYRDVSEGWYTLYSSQLLLLACKSSAENPIKFEIKRAYKKSKLDNTSKS